LAIGITSYVGAVLVQLFRRAVPVTIARQAKAALGLGGNQPQPAPMNRCAAADEVREFGGF
jgi:hypothetical protein